MSLLNTNAGSGNKQLKGLLTGNTMMLEMQKE